MTASRTKCANLTWLPLEIMHRGHTWHDYPWPCVSLTWLLYNLQLWRHGCWLRKFTVRFRWIRKEIASSMYNNISCCHADVCQSRAGGKYFCFLYLPAGSISQPLIKLLLASVLLSELTCLWFQATWPSQGLVIASQSTRHLCILHHCLWKSLMLVSLTPRMGLTVEPK